MLLLAHVGTAQHPEPLGVGGHEAVLDSVVHHLDEVAGAVWPTVQITLFSSAADPLASGSPRNVARTRGQPLENRVEVLDDVFLASNHHAVTAFQTPDAAAGTNVVVVNKFVRQVLRTLYVMHVV